MTVESEEIRVTRKTGGLTLDPQTRQQIGRAISRRRGQELLKDHDAVNKILRLYKAGDSQKSIGQECVESSDRSPIIAANAIYNVIKETLPKEERRDLSSKHHSGRKATSKMVETARKIGKANTIEELTERGRLAVTEGRGQSLIDYGLLMKLGTDPNNLAAENGPGIKKGQRKWPQITQSYNELTGDNKTQGTLKHCFNFRRRKQESSF